MSNIARVEEVEYQSANGGENLIGFHLHYTNGDIYPIGPILLRDELTAILAHYNLESQAAE